LKHWKLERGYTAVFFLSKNKHQVLATQRNMDIPQELFKTAVAITKSVPSVVTSIIPKLPEFKQFTKGIWWPDLSEKRNHQAIATVLLLSIVLSVISMFALGEGNDEWLGEGEEWLGEEEEPTLMDVLSETVGESLSAFLGAPKAAPKTAAKAAPKAAGKKKGRFTGKKMAARFFWNMFVLGLISWLVINQVVVSGQGQAYVPYRSAYRPSYRSY
jgi:hypothetical protein